MTAVAAVGDRERSADLVDVARREGPAAALRALHATVAPQGLVCGASGWTMAPPQDVPETRRFVLGDRIHGRADVALDLRDSPALDAAGLVAVHVRLRGFAVPDVAPRVDARLAGRSGQLRLGLALRLSDATQAHLADRTSGGVPLLQHQLVKGLLAEAALDLLLARAGLEAADFRPDAAVRAHGRITRAGRTLLQLLGGSGYLLTGPGADAHVSELIENLFVAGPGPQEATS
jgi:hypothetical protein